MNRRKFIGLLTGTAIALKAVGLKAFSTIKPTSHYTIGQIFAVSWRAIKNSFLFGPNARPFASPELNKLVDEGVIEFVSLGETVEIPQFDGTRKQYEVKQLAIYVTWTQGDENANPRESQKISLVKQLGENAIATHDTLLLEEAKGCKKLFISKQYHYHLSEEMALEGENAHYRVLSTAFCKVPA